MTHGMSMGRVVGHQMITHTQPINYPYPCYCLDDSNVPLSTVINDTLGILINKTYNLGYIILKVKQAADQTLMVAGDVEDIWV